MSEHKAYFSQQEFADHVGITQTSVSGLFSRSILSRTMTLAEARLAYCAHLREQAAGRSMTLVEERARLAAAQREKVELQNAVTRGELAPLALLEELIAKTGAQAAGILDAIPGAIRRRNTALTADDLEVIAEETAKARNAVASMQLADLGDDEIEAAR